MIHKLQLIFPYHTADVDGISVEHLRGFTYNEDAHFVLWRAAFQDSKTDPSKGVSGILFNEEFNGYKGIILSYKILFELGLERLVRL